MIYKLNKLPPVIVLEPTTFCNMNCIICPNSKLKKKGEINTQLVKKIASQLDSNVKHIQLYYLGEPTLHKDIIEIIKIIKCFSTARIELSTNLIELKNERFAEDFLLSGIDVLICCIDGLSDDSYSAIRNNPEYKKIVRIVKFLSIKNIEKSAEVDIIVKLIETTFNTKEKDKFIEYWKNVAGVTPFISWLNTWGGTMKELNSIMVKGAPNANKQRKPCAELWNKMVIRWDGNVVLCCHDWNSDKVIGNTNISPLIDIWDNRIITQIRKKHLQCQFTGICAECKEWSTAEEYLADYKIPACNVVTPF